MTKIVIFVVLVCCVTISLGFPPILDRKYGFSDPLDSPGIWSSKSCRDPYLAQKYLINIRQLITTLETNGSYKQIRDRHAHLIDYLKDDKNAALLISSCDQFMIGLENARKRDSQGSIQQ
ncbi:unnamed protein product [Rotaria sordida]|uniref:Uncharacterized protein n=1 Tax=Rotaria sordida TaxID=392033 RepID=A0A815GI32_9BILA|nr:unnamed protein product [Rotaria sordida]CAF1339130.1 unnamed protein product [Rotaria sordida]